MPATFGLFKKRQAPQPKPKKLDPAKIDPESKEALLPWAVKIFYVNKAEQVIRYQTLRDARDAADWFMHHPIVHRVKLIPPESEATNAK